MQAYNHCKLYNGSLVLADFTSGAVFRQANFQNIPYANLDHANFP